MDRRNETLSESDRNGLERIKEAGQKRQRRNGSRLYSSKEYAGVNEGRIRKHARRIRQVGKGYRDYLVKARSEAGITSISDFDQLNPYLLDAMIEGYERQQLSMRVAWVNMLQQVPFLAQPIQLDNGNDQQLANSMQQFIDREAQDITNRHKDQLTDVKPSEIKQADAFKEVFLAREKLKKGG